MDDVAGPSKEDESPRRSFKLKDAIERVQPQLKSAGVFKQQLINLQERRMANGRRRHSVALGVAIEAKEAARTTIGSYNTYLSHQMQELLEHKYSALGRWIGAKPRLSMLIGTLALLSGLPGSFLLEGEAYVLWIAFDTRMYENFALQSNHFYKDYEHTVHLDHGMFHPPRPGLLQFTPKSGDERGILTKPFLADVLDILNVVYNDTKVGASAGAPLSPTGVQGYDNVCDRNGVGLCRSKGSELFAPVVEHRPAVLAGLPSPTARPPLAAANGTLPNDYWSVLDSAEGANTLTYPSAVRLDTSGSVVIPDATAAGLHGTFDFSGWLRASIVYPSADLSPLPSSYWDGTLLAIPISTAYFKEGDSRYTAVAKWEKAVLSMLDAKDYPHADTVDVTFVMEASVQTEIAASVESAVPMVFVTIGLMLLYSITFLFTQARVNAAPVQGPCSLGARPSWRPRHRPPPSGRRCAAVRAR